MRKLLTAICAVLLVPVATPARADDGITGYLRKHAETNHIPGLAAVVVRDGRPAQKFTLGSDGNGATVTAQTPFLLGSVSKPFTALAVMQLVEAGRVGLDDLATRHLPWLRLRGREHDITVRHLLTQTSGLPPIIDRTDRFDNTPGGLDRAVRDLATLDGIGTPGKEHRYSDANYAILGSLVQAVSGQPFGGYLRQHVLDPLGMTHSAATEREAAGVPPGHRMWFGRPYRFDAPYDTAGVPYGYLAASLDDVTRFVEEQLGGGKVLSPQGIAETHVGRVDTGGGRYGYGWRQNDDLVWHAGATPGYFSHIVLDPGARTGVAVLSNVYSPALDPALAAAAFGVAALVRGERPDPAPADPVFTYLLVALAVVAVVLLVAIARSRRSARKGSPVRAAAWLAGCGALAAAVALGVPAALGGALPQALLWTPDVGWSIVTVTVLSVLLGLARAVFSLFRRTGPAPAGRTGNPAPDHSRSGAAPEPVPGSPLPPR